MELIRRLDALQREAGKLARSAAELATVAEAIRAEIEAQAAAQTAARGIAALEPEAPRQDPVSLDTMIECKIERAWEYDIFAVIERLKLAGIPAIHKRSEVNGTGYIGVTSGDLIQAVANAGNSMSFRWYGAGQ